MSLMARQWIIDHFDLLLSEIRYHRDHRDDFSDEGIVIWDDSSDQTREAAE